jgi:GntR family transcriptional repressor for pyruvate dehydrogenase complex
LTDHVLLAEEPTDFSAIERSVIPQSIAERILGLVQSGKLKPGQRLPSERELALQLKVSRPSLREALRALHLMRVLEIQPGAGVFVSSLEPEHLAGTLEVLFQLLVDVSYLQVLETRLAIEPVITALAVTRITDDQLEVLRACRDASLALLDDPSGFVRNDIQLHERIVQACGNPLLISIYTSVSNLAVETRQRTVEIPGVRRVVSDHHSNIVEAFEARDPMAASAAMEQHLHHVVQSLRDAAPQMVKVGG